MKKVLILGAGLVVRPIVQYLLDKGYYVTVATRTKSKADEMIGGHANGKSVAWTVEDEPALDKMIAEHDLSVSLLPYAHHVMVAKKCIAHKKNMVTTSYVKPAMQALDAEAKAAGIIILNELGLDPGIDHMSAMRIIDHIHGKGGKVEEFYSICGALPAPEGCDNPFNYKFSWSPKGVVMASNNDANYLKQGKIIPVPTENLFKNPIKTSFPEVGNLEIYPNRDSVPYIELYGIPETRTILRGTFRHPGWCESLDAMKALKLTSNDKYDFTGKTFTSMVAMLIGENDPSDIKAKAAKFLGLNTNAHALKAIEWLGLFDNKPMNRKEDSPFEVTSDLMIEKMMIGREERDMVVLQHTFLASYPNGTKEVIKSSMLDFGTLATDTAIARTVALPAAMGVEMILAGKIKEKGVYIPVLPGIYNPILDRLETVGIKMVEEFGLPESEMLK
jgi:saccharopine dehydrogenase-like NADP-dependent oxidoreductase